MSLRKKTRNVSSLSFPMPAVITRRGALKSSLAVAFAGALPQSVAAQSRQVNIYNWDTYIAEDTIPNFSENTGIDVRYDLFSDNDELFAKIREGNPGYDVIYPSNDYVERMIAASLLEELRHDLIPNFANIDPVFADPEFDPGRSFSMPYMWGTIGIGFRSSVTSVSSWKDFLENEDLAGRISLLNGSTIIQVALKYLGLSGNSSDPQEIEAAAEALIAVKDHIKAFAPDTGQDLLISGEVDACMEWSGDILQVMLEDDDLSYALPSEGGLLWEDTMAIPKDAPHPDEAHEWINFILDAQVHAQIATEIKYACPNLAAQEFIPKEDLENAAIYPDRAALEKSEVSIYKGEEVESLYEEALTKVLSA